jgi:hypothetical protein
VPPAGPLFRLTPYVSCRKGKLIYASGSQNARHTLMAEPTGGDNARIGPSHDQPDRSRQLRPVNRIELSIFTTDRHQRFSRLTMPCKSSRPGRQPRNRTVTNVVDPSDIPHRLAFVASSDSLADLVRSELRASYPFSRPAPWRARGLRRSGHRISSRSLRFTITRIEIENGVSGSVPVQERKVGSALFAKLRVRRQRESLPLPFRHMSASSSHHRPSPR